MNIRQNIRYVNMLYNSFSGEHGELTAITQYLYEHIELKRYENFSKILLKISIEEMRHLSLIGELIKRLGGKPYYIDNEKIAWNSKSSLRYHFNSLYDVLTYNIESEKKAIEEYRHVIKYTQNKSIRDLIERIILDEQTHLEIFNRLR